MAHNLCLLPRDEKYQIQLDYEASFWAYQVTKGKKGRDVIYQSIGERPKRDQAYLKTQFERYLGLMSI